MKTKQMMMLALLCAAGVAQAAFVTIGDAGNAADTTGYGAVGYTYQISATEVTIAEFMASGAGNGNENYWNDGTRTVGANAPASYVSLYEAMKYCNWLTSGDVNLGAYVFSGGVYQSTDRASAIATYGTVYALPTEDEWYKAAYYTGNSGDLWSLYANGTDTVPNDVTTTDNTGWNFDGVNTADIGAWVTGGSALEQNGTFDMMGNVWEWVEDSGGMVRGGVCEYGEDSFRSSERMPSGALSPTTEYYALGFRVVAIPEPATALLFGIGGLGAWMLRRNKLKSSEE